MSHLEKWFYSDIAQTSVEPIALEIESAAGIYLYDTKDNAYIDFISGICVSNLGHGDGDIIQAIWQQTRRYLHPMVYGEGIVSPQVMYGHALLESLADNLSNIYFTNSGTEAIEGALKVAKKYTGRNEIVACWNAYHGSSHGSLSVSGNPHAKIGYGPLLPHIHHIPFNDVEALSKITQQTAAFIVEPIQGAGGVILPEPGYLQAVRERCNQTDTLLILDEIQTGFGRTGNMFAHEKYGFVPDILILAKALGGGLPLGAFITSRPIMEVIQSNPPLGHITTFGGHPLCCAAGMALFNKLRNSHILETIPAKERIITDQLKHPRIKEVRGTGLLFAMLLSSAREAHAVQHLALKKGLITISFLSEPCGLRIAPPLIISEAELQVSIEILLQAVDEACHS